MSTDDTDSDSDSSNDPRPAPAVEDGQRRSFMQGMVMGGIALSHGGDGGLFDGLFGSSDESNGPDTPGLLDDMVIQHDGDTIIADPEIIDFVGPAIDEIEQPNHYDDAVRIRLVGGDGFWSQTDSGALTPEDNQPLNLDDLNNSKYLGPDNSESEIATELGNADADVVLYGDLSGLSDRLDITADGVTLHIAPNATVGFADDANPTTIAGEQGNDHRPVIVSQNKDNVQVVNRGTIDANQQNFSRTAGVYIEGGSGHVFDSPGRIVDVKNPSWIIDCHDLTVGRVHNDAADNPDGTTPGAALVLEGVDSFTVHEAITDGGAEAVDFNSRSEDGTVVSAVARDGASQIVDFNESRNITVVSAVAVGSTPNGILVQGASNPRHTTASSFGNANGNTVMMLRGDFSGYALKTGSGGPTQDLEAHVKVSSDGQTPVLLNATEADQLNGLRVSGIAECTAAGGDAWKIGSNGNACQDAVLDIEGRATDGTPVELRNFDDVTGKAIGRDSGGHGVRVFADAGDTVQNVDLWVRAHHNDDHGVRVTGGGTVNDVTITGRAYSNNQAANGSKDISVASSATGVDVKATWETREDSGVRTTWNGLGYNDGPPGNGGQWNGQGFEGLTVRDTTNANTWKYNNGTWSQIASA